MMKKSGEVLRYLRLPDQVFGEGIALVNDHLYQLTWKAQTAFRFNLSAFTEGAKLEASTLSYEGEGWGLCYDDTNLWMSNGSDTLAIRDPETFEVVDTRQVTLDGVPLGQLTTAPEATAEVSAQASTPTPAYSGPRLDQLNELECVGDSIYANVWLTDYIFRIDKATGAITGWIDATGLLTAEEQAAAKEMNGIVYLPDSDTFLVTGKYWPKMFEVNFIPAAQRDSSAAESATPSPQSPGN